MKSSNLGPASAQCACSNVSSGVRPSARGSPPPVTAIYCSGLPVLRSLGRERTFPGTLNLSLNQPIDTVCSCLVPVTVCPSLWQACPCSSPSGRTRSLLAPLDPSPNPYVDATVSCACCLIFLLPVCAFSYFVCVVMLSSVGPILPAVPIFRLVQRAQLGQGSPLRVRREGSGTYPHMEGAEPTHSR